MLKGNDVIGKPIFAYDIAEKLENKIEDLILSQNSQQLLGFLVDKRGWTADALVLLFEQIDALGADAVIVRSTNVFVPMREIGIEQVLEQGRLKGSKVLTTDGHALGTIVDIYFDEQTGTIQGYEVSGGTISDSYAGRAFIRASESLKIGNQVVFVSPSTVVEEQGGIKGAFQKTTEQMQKAAHVTGEKLHSAAQVASEKVQEVVKQAEKKLEQASLDQSIGKNSFIGKTVKQTVHTEHGTPLIVRGQRITPALAAIAQRWQVMSKLRQAVECPDCLSQSEVEQAKGKQVNTVVKSEEGFVIAALDQIVDEEVIEKAQIYSQEKALLKAVGISVNQPLDQVKQRVNHLWQQVQEKVCDLPDNSNSEEQLIQYSLGRPVKRDILDEQNRVILRVGELITYQAIERAKQANVLALLLNSVYQSN